MFGMHWPVLKPSCCVWLYCVTKIRSMQDHDAAASKQDQYLSEDSDDNMDVIMEEPILEVEDAILVTLC